LAEYGEWVRKILGKDNSRRSQVRMRQRYIREHPDDYDSAFQDQFVKFVDKLDPPPA
jgi:hypothetical protein